MIEISDPEVRKLQQILDEQKFIIICRNKNAGSPSINEIIIDDWGETLNCLNGIQGSALRVIGFASFEEFMIQLKKYYPDRAKRKQYPELYHFVKVSAE